LSLDDNDGLVVVNRGAYFKDPPNRRTVNGLGLIEGCVEPPIADITFVDVAELKERKRIQIDRFLVRNGLVVGDGWILVGDAPDDCRRETQAVAYKVKKDGSVERLWRDASPFETSGRGIRKKDGAIEIVGYAERSVAIREQSLDARKIDFIGKRSGNEAYISGEIFSVRLSDRGIEERRDFVGAGLPITPMGMASTSDRSAIFGTVGSRPLWMAH